MVDYTAFTQPTRVQVSDVLPSSDGDWTTQDGLIPIKAMEGCGQFIGSAQLIYYAGVVANVGDSDVVINSILDLNGEYVRIQINDGTDMSPDWVTIWYGIVKSQTLNPDGRNDSSAGGLQTFLCAGLPLILDFL